MTFELLVFGAIAVIAITVLAAIVIAIGVPFGMSPKLAIPIAAYIFGVIFPGGMNVWIAVVARDGEDATERVAAFVRGVAMIVGWTALIFWLGPKSDWTVYLPYLCATCAALFAWSIWREERHRRKKLEEKGLIRYD